MFYIKKVFVAIKNWFILAWETVKKPSFWIIPVKKPKEETIVVEEPEVDEVAEVAEVTEIETAREKSKTWSAEQD